MRYTHIIAPLLAAAVSFSCTKEIAPSTESELIEMTFSAFQQDDGAETKTEVDANRHILWQETDALSIFALDQENSGNYKFALQNGSGTTTGSFKGAATESERYLAIYPYNQAIAAGADISSDGVTFSWDGTAQTPVPGSFDPSKALMAGISSGSSISFTNLCAFVKITTDFPCASIGFYTPDKKVGTAEVKVSFDDNNTVSLKKVSESGDTAAIVAPQGSVIAPGTYYIAMLPTGMTGFKIVVTTTGGKTLIRDAMDKGWLTFNPGMVLNVGSFSADKFDGGDGFIGSGTAEDPYLIGNKYQFDLLRTLLSGSSSGSYINKCYLQTADIDFGGETTDFGSNGFNGTYDGGGHKLTNLVLKNEVLDSEESVYASALICKATDAKIVNLTVECKGFECNTGAGTAYYGGLIGLANSTVNTNNRVQIENCTFKNATESATFSTGTQNVCWGGFVGFSQGSLKVLGCTNEFGLEHTGVGGSSGKEFCSGGFVGKICRDSGSDYWCNFDRCRNNVNIIARGAPGNCYAGGFIGYVEEGATTEDCTLRLVNCINRGNIIANAGTVNDDAFSGGLVGKHDSDGGDCGNPMLFNCMNSGSVSAAGDDAYAGGMMGWNYDGDTRVCACANVGNVFMADEEGQSEYYGALCGTDDGEYYNCAFTSGKIIYGTIYNDASNVHNAYSIDNADPAGQLYAATMNDLAAGVSATLRDEMTNATGFSIMSWTGLWNHQNQQGLDLVM